MTDIIFADPFGSYVDGFKEGSATRLQQEEVVFNTVVQPALNAREKAIDRQIAEAARRRREAASAAAASRAQSNAIAQQRAAASGLDATIAAAAPSTGTTDADRGLNRPSPDATFSFGSAVDAAPLEPHQFSSTFGQAIGDGGADVGPAPTVGAVTNDSGVPVERAEYRPGVNFGDDFAVAQAGIGNFTQKAGYGIAQGLSDAGVTFGNNVVNPITRYFTGGNDINGNPIRDAEYSQLAAPTVTNFDDVISRRRNVPVPQEAPAVSQQRAPLVDTVNNAPVSSFDSALNRTPPLQLVPQARVSDVAPAGPPTDSLISRLQPLASQYRGLGVIDEFEEMMLLYGSPRNQSDIANKISRSGI